MCEIYSSLVLVCHSPLYSAAYPQKNYSVLARGGDYFFSAKCIFKFGSNLNDLKKGLNPLTQGVK